MNLSQARDELRARGFDGLSDARCNTFLNAAKNALEDYAPWPWLDASTSGTAPLTVSDLRSVLYVYNSDTGCRLVGADRRFLRDTFTPDLTTTGPATHWYLTGLDEMSVFPADSSSTFQVDYLKTTDELSADSDEPEFPARLHPVWVDLACVEAYMDADEAGMAQTLQAKVDVRLARAVDAFFSRNQQNPEYQTVEFASEDW